MKIVRQEAEEGKYIVIEGGEGCGKTYHAIYLTEFLKEKGRKVVSVAEPGGTRSSDEIKKIILADPSKRYNLNPFTETLLLIGSRSELFEDVVIPYIKKGFYVISDRSFLSTKAYQGAGRGIDQKIIDDLNEIAMQGLKPNIGFIIDVDPIVGMGRQRTVDRISIEPLEFHEKIREEYLNIAKRDPSTFRVIKYKDWGEKGMQEEIRRQVQNRFSI
ncbi:dTMP kinase [Nanoarchaeota archaeon]